MLIGIKPPDSLFDQLRGAGLVVGDDGLGETETIVFLLWPLDLVLARQFGDAGAPLREKLQDTFVQYTLLRLPGATAEQKKTLQDFLPQRFAEYAGMYRSGGGGSEGGRMMAIRA